MRKSKKQFEKLEVNLAKRTETRYITGDIDKLLSELHKHFSTVTFSDDKWVQNIYFDTPTHEVAMNKAIKARRYLPDNTKLLNVFQDDYIIEVKDCSGLIVEKQRYMAKLSEVPAVIKQHGFFVDYDLIPFISISFHREHFSPKDYPELKITIDRDVTYHYVASEGLVKLGSEEDLARVEIKASDIDHPYIAVIEDILKSCSAIPFIPKKAVGYTMLANYKYPSLDNIYNDLAEVEYHFSQTIANEKNFRAFIKLLSNSKEFTFLDKYYFFQVGGIHFPEEDENVELRIEHNGNDYVLTRLTRTITDTSHPQVKKITRLNETVSYEDFQNWFTRHHELSTGNFVTRKTKSTYIESVKTKRIYEVLVHNYNDREYILEVRYTGLNKNSETNFSFDEVIADITSLEVLIKN